jgi:hypothetical protein
MIPLAPFPDTSVFETEYPNIWLLLDGMPEQMRSLALAYLSYLPVETVEQIETHIPGIVEGTVNNDDSQIIAILTTLGANQSQTEQIIGMRHGLHTEK